MIVDVSKHQESIDWGQLAPQLDFAILRASVGVNADSRYREYVSGCERYRVPYHAFHYLKATSEAAARMEAKVMAETCAETSPLFYVIDAEYSGIAASSARAICEAFEDGLRHYIGQDIRVAVYIGHHLYKSWALDYGRYAYVWIPRYGVNDGKPHSRPDWPCDLWQYTSVGRVNGISGNVDLDQLMGTKPMSYFTGVKEESGMLTGKQLAEYCEKVYKAGWVYWYGTYGNKCSTSLYNSKKKQYPSHYTSDRASGYQKDIANGKTCADCVGLIKSFFWTGGEFGATPKYGTNHCPDKSANGMIEYCSETGPIKTIPDEPGLVVWKSGHIGVYVGGGYTVELKGFAYDCQRNKVTSGPWTKWGRLPKSMIAYTGESVTPAPVADGLRRGDGGEDVRAMQRALLKWDADCLPKYGADGDFGSETEKAVKAFQKAAGLDVTGVYDEATRAALAAWKPPVEGCDGDSCPIEPPVQRFVQVKPIHVRSAPGDGYMSLGIVHPGDRLPYAGETHEVDGVTWYLVEYENQNGWVSSESAEVVN